jgi:hypothetical protein
MYFPRSRGQPASSTGLKADSPVALRIGAISESSPSTGHADDVAAKRNTYPDYIVLRMPEPADNAIMLVVARSTALRAHQSMCSAKANRDAQDPNAFIDPSISLVEKEVRRRWFLRCHRMVT